MSARSGGSSRAEFEFAAPWLPRRAALTPDASALSWPGRDTPLCYAELLERAEAAAHDLRRTGISAGDRVAVMLASGPEYAVLFHAVQLCGAVLMPMNVRLREAELVPQLELARPMLLLHAPGDALAIEVARKTSTRALEVECPGDGRLGIPADTEASAANAAPLCSELDPEAPAALLFTSGTTGNAKAAVLPIRAFQSSARASAEVLGVEGDDEWLACMPLFHVGGLSILARSVLGGTSVRIHTSFDAAAVSADLDAGRASQVSLVATMLQRLLEERGEKRSPARLRTVLLGGGPCSTSVLERALELGYPLAPTYGLTEACSQVATRPAGNRELPLHAGLCALPGVEVEVVDSRGRALPRGAEGEIVVRGEIVMSRYLDAPEATAEALRDGWLQTGDVGRLDAEGGLEVLDRRDDLIVSGGENVIPAEVESVLEGHPELREAGVVARADREYGARPVAFAVRAAGSNTSAEDFLAYCRERLAGYKVPVEIRFCDALPRTAAGKLQRARLRERL